MQISIQQIKDACKAKGINLFNTIPERSEQLYFNGEDFPCPQMIFVDEANDKIICPVGYPMPLDAQKVSEAVKHCIGGSKKNPCKACKGGSGFRLHSA